VARFQVAVTERSIRFLPTGLNRRVEVDGKRELAIAHLVKNKIAEVDTEGFCNR